MAHVEVPREWLQRIRGEYSEIPDLRVAGEQADKLWGLPPRTCRAVLEALVRTGFLERTGASDIRAGR
jgi:hypothetical protein